MLRWGLVPFWSKTATTKYALINARSEGIETKPSFRSPFRHRRCIIPASGFYEWRHADGGKQPFFIRPIGGGTFALAGVWDHWEGEEGQVIDSCSIITTTANTLMQAIHDRMPVILPAGSMTDWLNPETGKEEALALLAPFAESAMEAYPVGSRVNSPKNNGPECVAGVGA